MTNSLISPRLIILVTLFALLLAMAWSGSYAAPVAADHPFPCGGADEPPCEPPDGTLGGDPVIDTVNDISGSSANTGASIFIDASVLEQLPQPVAIDVTIFTHQGPPVLPNPRTLFVDFILNPNPTPPDLPGAGATITLPLFSSGTPGANVYLYDFDAALQSATPLGITGSVDKGGQTATFSGVTSFSEFIGLPQPKLEFFQFECTDGVDNDDDYLVDGDDPDCQGPGGGGPPPPPTPEQLECLEAALASIPGAFEQIFGPDGRPPTPEEE